MEEQAGDCHEARIIERLWCVPDGVTMQLINFVIDSGRAEPYVLHAGNEDVVR